VEPVEPPNFGGDAGQPVLPVATDDLKTAFEIFLNQARRHPGGGSAISVGSFALRLQAWLRPRLSRLPRLDAAISPAAYQRTDGPLDQRRPSRDERVFQEFAGFPMEWTGVGVPQETMPFDAEEFFRRLGTQNLGVEPPRDTE